MRRITIFISFLGFWILPLISGRALEEALPERSWFPLWEKARELDETGAYLEAKEIYESLLQRESLGKDRPLVQSEYGAVRMKILFSPIKTPDSFYHTVAPGDTLYELAQKYGTTVGLLKRSNQLASADRLYPGMKLKVTQTQFSILIEKGENRLTLLADGEPLKQYSVATGKEGSTPAGTFKVVNKLEDPTWFNAGVIVPPDSPKNILGSRWLGFDLPGYGIHGTTQPATIGSQTSRGCVRMFNADVEEVYDLVPVGTPVTVKA